MGIGAIAVGVVSAVAVGIALNQPTIHPKTPEVKATSENKESKETKETEKPTTVAVSNNETPAPETPKAQSTPKAKTEARPASATPAASTTPAAPDTSNNESTQSEDNTVVENNTNNSTDNNEEEEREKAASWVPPNNTTTNGGRLTDAANTYPYKDNCPLDNLKYSIYGGSVCQSTSYVSWKAYEKWEIVNTWGGNSANYVNATNYYVPKNGARTYVNTTPAPYTIAVQTGGGAYGHVMWVESVNENGTINVTEYNVNWPAIGCNTADFCARRNVSTAGAWFVHFE